MQQSEGERLEAMSGSGYGGDAPGLLGGANSGGGDDPAGQYFAQTATAIYGGIEPSMGGGTGGNGNFLNAQTFTTIEPGMPPIPIPPSFTPGTSENQQFTSTNGKALQEIGRDFGNVFNALRNLAAPSQAQSNVHGNSYNSMRPNVVYELKFTQPRTINGISYQPGDIAKYGITSASNPMNRYTINQYKAEGTVMQNIVPFPNRFMARYFELQLNLSYFATYGHLPPLSSRF